MDPTSSTLSNPHLHHTPTFPRLPDKLVPHRRTGKQMALEPPPTITNTAIDIMTAYPYTAETEKFVPPGCGGTTVAHNPISVQCANNQQMHSIGTIALDIPALPALARQASVFRDMQKPLLYVPVLADNACTMIFDKQQVLVQDAKHMTIL